MKTTKTGASQVAFLEQHLRGTSRELTSAQASSAYGIKNLRARIFDLRKAGLNVQSRKNYRGAASYSIPSRDLFGSRTHIFA